MKVLQICTHFPINYPGGITKYVKKLSEELVCRGVDVGILSGGRNDMVEGVTMHYYKTKALRQFPVSFIDNDPEVEKLFKMITKEKYDLLHIHSTGDLAMNFYKKISSFGIPYIISLHDYFYVCPRVKMVDYEKKICRTVKLEKCSRCLGRLEQIDFLYRVARKIDIQLPRIESDMIYKRLYIMRCFFNNALKVLPVSKKVEEIFSEIIQSGNYETCHIGNDTAYINSFPKRQTDFINLSFLGTLNKAKGSEVLAYFIENLSNKFKVHFYGRANTKILKKLEGKGLIYHGTYNDVDLPDIMKNTDIGLVFSVWEDNAPQVAMEFINYKIPVIGTNRGGIPDFVKDKQNGIIIDPDNKASLQSAIEWLTNLDHSKIREISRNIKQLKTPKEHANEIIDLYNFSLS